MVDIAVREGLAGGAVGDEQCVVRAACVDGDWLDGDWLVGVEIDCGSHFLCFFPANHIHYGLPDYF